VTLRLVVRPETEADIAEAYDWYASRGAGLGADFLEAVGAALDDIQQSPQRFPRMHENVQRARLRRFPYGIFFLQDAQRIVVMACMHGRRDPRRLLERL
jgi:toxin ParE1/3/4